jgi:hypothetical protein
MSGMIAQMSRSCVVRMTTMNTPSSAKKASTAPMTSMGSMVRARARVLSTARAVSILAHPGSRQEWITCICHLGAVARVPCYHPSHHACRSKSPFAQDCVVGLGGLELLTKRLLPRHE